MDQQHDAPLGHATENDRSPSGGPVDDRAVLRSSQLQELRAVLASVQDGSTDLDGVVRAAAAAVPHADHCGIALVPGGSGRPATIAASGELPCRIDALQYRLEEGPCATASETSGVVVVDDLEGDLRWPAFAAAGVAETSVRSLLSVCLPLTGSDQAVITFSAERPHAFEATDVDTAVIFALSAAVVLQSSTHAREARNFRTALDSSRRIGTAIGIVMARELLTSEAAFERLVQASQRLNRKLRDIAAEVAETGSLPGVPEPSGGP